jgi:hypothetical protein
MRISPHNDLGNLALPLHYVDLMQREKSIPSF